MSKNKVSVGPPETPDESLPAWFSMVHDIMASHTDHDKTLRVALMLEMPIPQDFENFDDSAISCAMTWLGDVENHEEPIPCRLMLIVMALAGLRSMIRSASKSVIPIEAGNIMAEEFGIQKMEEIDKEQARAINQKLIDSLNENTEMMDSHFDQFPPQIKLAWAQQVISQLGGKSLINESGKRKTGNPFKSKTLTMADSSKQNKDN